MRLAAGAADDPKERRNVYVLVQPNLTPEDALKLAQRKLAELSRHERIISLLSPKSCPFLRKIPSDHSRNDGRRGEPPRRCGSGTSGLRQIVPIGSGDPLDHADIQQSAQLPG